MLVGTVSAPALCVLVLLPASQWCTGWWQSTSRVCICTPKVWELLVSMGWSLPQLECRGCLLHSELDGQPVKSNQCRVTEEVGGDSWQYQTQAWLCSLHSQVSPEQIFMPPLSFSSWLLCFKSLFVVPQLTAYSSWLFTFPLALSADSLSGSSGYLVHLCCLHCHAFLSSCWPSHFAKGEM